jgi:hypothetical protein
MEPLRHLACGANGIRYHLRSGIDGIVRYRLHLAGASVDQRLRLVCESPSLDNDDLAIVFLSGQDDQGAKGGTSHESDYEGTSHAVHSPSNELDRLWGFGARCRGYNQLTVRIQMVNA